MGTKTVSLINISGWVPVLCFLIYVALKPDVIVKECPTLEKFAETFKGNHLVIEVNKHDAKYIEENPGGS